MKPVQGFARQIAGNDIQNPQCTKTYDCQLKGHATYVDPFDSDDRVRAREVA